MNQGNGKLNRQKCRAIGYKIEYNDENKSDAEKKVIQLLQNSDVISEFYCNRGFCWFNGKPGKELRELKKEINLLLTGI